MARYFDLFLRIGGYWSRSDAYLGGESHEIGRSSSNIMSFSMVRKLVMDLGYEENMKKISWFPPDTPEKRQDIEDDKALNAAVVIHAHLSGAVTLYVVRDNDPYLYRRMEVGDSEVGEFDGDDEYNETDDDNENDDDSENDDDDEIVADEGENDEGENDDDENEDANDDESSDDGNVRAVFDDTKYHKFRVGQEYLTKDSFKRAVSKYAVTKRRNIGYKKSESRRVVAICVQQGCPFRISASINSTSNRFVIRSLNDEHNCTWQGKIKLLNNARISDLYIDDFRVKPDLSATQLQKVLLRRNINVPHTKCERPFTPRSRAKLDDNIYLTKNCSALSCGLGKFEVSYFNDRFLVTLRDNVSCSCRMYKLSGIPCCHIISALREYRQGVISPDTLISDWFTAERWKRCYQNLLQPVNGMNLWDVTTNIRVKPPLYKRPPGRPSGKKRKRAKGEPRPNPGRQSRRGLVSSCSICKQSGHNKTRCQNVTVPKPPKKPSGRPRKRPLEEVVNTVSRFPDAENVTVPKPLKKPLGRPRKRPFEEAVDTVSRLSDALPRKKPGRPRTRQFENGSSSASQSQTRSHQPIYDSGPTYIPMEGTGVFTSPETGDDYVQIGRLVIDTLDNTVLPSSLYKARERKKLAVLRGRGYGRGK